MDNYSNDTKNTNNDSVIDNHNNVPSDSISSSKASGSGFFTGLLGGVLGALLIFGIIALTTDFFKVGIGMQSTSSNQVVLPSGKTIADVATTVSPSVVSISVESQATNVFFQNISQESAGTGLILTADGLVVTNKHVVPTGTTKIKIVTADGKEYDDVSIVDKDPLNDVAFLRINGTNNLKPAKLGNSSSTRVGDSVIAIGNALGQFNTTVTSGIISAKGRPINAGSDGGTESLVNLLQTDASINPGNSGGPLVNINGEVIGINTAIAGNAENIGFAIPINDIKPLFVSVKENGHIVHPFLGVRYATVTPDIAAQLKLQVEQGAVVDSLFNIENNPAVDAGIKPGDVIVSINEKRIDSNNQLSTVIGGHKVGESIRVKLNRYGRTITVNVKLAEAPSL